MTRLGLTPEQLRAVHPGVITCSITGYGDDGPMADAPALALDATATEQLGERTLPASPFVFDGVRQVTGSVPPVLGAQTNEVLG